MCSMKSSPGLDLQPLFLCLSHHSLTTRAMPPPPPPLSLLIILTATILTAAYSQPATTYANCDRTFSCGAIRNVTFPFTGRDRPSYCGLPDFALTCRDNTITELTHDSLAYRVLQLDHTHKTLILSRSDLYNNTCPSEFRNTTLNPTLFSYSGPQNEDLNLFYGCNTSTMPQRPSTHFTCNSGGFNDPDWYHLIGPVPSDPFLRLIHCSMSISVPVSRAAANSLSNFLISVEQALMQGFNVSYSVPNERLCSECNRLGGQCGFDHAVLSQFVCICGDRPCPFTLTLAPEASPAPDASLEGRSSISAPVGTIAGVTVGLVIVCIITLNMTILCCLKRRPSLGRPNKGKNQDIEKFLLQNGLAPKRYKYSEIKKLTKSFNDKLGQGGYGSVYKGILPDGSLIAVKVLKEVDSDGEEFVNEVASISKTSHVNIVSLVGFCYEGNKRALVYEYMPNKSLDKFLSDDVSTANRDRCLNLEKLFNIAVGIARGLEYLHIGCSTRIVHFDIKPQNILLDEDFCPKIADFGLAKLCKKKQSVLSMLGTRGTIGYIAPEIFSRNFGGVSHKSDVYSYGMMVLEMAGAKQIVEADTIQSSENYFPDKIYEHVILGVTRKLDGLMIEEEDEIAKRMFLVGFWCIQTTPSNRPSMSKVVEMLEGSLESIQIPPKPVLFTLAQSERNISSSLSAYTETENSAEG